ncbi:tRNA A64-2'-O-ribosylphosphate transferase [Cytospora paraplurivora]|uniref:tRNA A64-2'-O-ribosylphosphate transferase n=1 Tax=Cytospora paraplurivora TaxID=2898453 RepID=A0AAN9UU21_9PEZI
MPDLSDLIFPSQEPDIINKNNNNNINKILGDLKRSNLSITNRLRSIREDAAFVEGVAAAFGGRRPLVANERCGSWYIGPGRKGASAYFKSTDGHTGQWKFSTRRLNLHLLPVIEEHDGIIIVDSTRRGKRMPDSLSKTVPIWCCVLNRALFPDLDGSYHNLHVPPNVVSDSERSQMLSRVPGFVASFLELKPDLAGLRAQISRPLRPAWVTQETELGHMRADAGGDDTIFDSFRPVICCTSSRRVTDGEMSGHSGYVQGAGDDTENWALDLTPPVFWDNIDLLLSTPEPGLPPLIGTLVAGAARRPSPPGGGGDGHDLPSTVRQLTPYLYVCPLPVPTASLPSRDEEGVEVAWCSVALSSSTTPAETWVKAADYMDAGLGKHKAASRNLRVALANICDFVSRFLGSDDRKSDGKRKRVVIADESGGKDLAIGVALALVCSCFSDEEGHILREQVAAGGKDGNEAAAGGGAAAGLSFNKTMIKVRLGRIMTAMPDANPNRATLQSVNSFLMDWR